LWYFYWILKPSFKGVFFNVSLVRICFVYVYSVVRDLIKEESETNGVLRTPSPWGSPGDSTWFPTHCWYLVHFFSPSPTQRTPIYHLCLIQSLMPSWIPSPWHSFITHLHRYLAISSAGATSCSNQHNYMIYFLSFQVSVTYFLKRLTIQTLALRVNKSVLSFVFNSSFKTALLAGF